MPSSKPSFNRASTKSPSSVLLWKSNRDALGRELIQRMKASIGVNLDSSAPARLRSRYRSTSARPIGKTSHAGSIVLA